MNVKLTTRVKKAILLTLMLSSLLAISVYFDAFGVRSYNPSKSNGFSQNGASIVNDQQHYSLLFKAEKPVNFKETDLKFFETDFLGLLNEVPMRDSNLFVGITNRGNSCYADSVIQMLFRIPTVHKIVANLDIYHSRVNLLISQNNNNNVIKNIFKGLKILEGLNHMFYQLQNNEALGATFEFGKSIQCLPGKYADNHQEDADEYFNFIMTTLKEVIPESQRHHLLLDISFDGTLKSTKDPHKTELKSQTDIESRISLPFNGKSDLQSLLDVYFAPETVQLGFDDGTPGSLERSKKLDNLPEIIVIQLQRLSIDFEAVSRGAIIRKGDVVDMPELIDFSKCISAKCSSKSTQYRLKMFVVHSGNHKGGHYYAYSRNNNSWCTLNDSRVTMIEDLNKVQQDQETGFLYFYERM